MKYSRHHLTTEQKKFLRQNKRNSEYIFEQTKKFNCRSSEHYQGLSEFLHLKEDGNNFTQERYFDQRNIDCRSIMLIF